MYTNFSALWVPWTRSLVTGLVFSCLTCCAVSNASDNDRPNVVQRSIDWPAAQRLASRHSDSAIAQNKIRSVRNSNSPNGISNAASNSKTKAALAVPLLLLPADFASSANVFADFKFVNPLLLQTTAGYTVVYKSSQIDVVIDASNAMMLTDGNRESIEQEFDGQYQLMEGGGGEKTIGRFGALYSVQLMCNRPATPMCVTEAMLNEVIDALDVYPTSVISE